MTPSEGHRGQPGCLEGVQGLVSVRAWFLHKQPLRGTSSALEGRPVARVLSAGPEAHAPRVGCPRQLAGTSPAFQGGQDLQVSLGPGLEFSAQSG